MHFALASPSGGARQPAWCTPSPHLRPLQIQLWQKNPPPPDPTRYHLTGFSIMLNEITPGLEKRLAPTDCRLRPDQHFLELGEYDKVCRQGGGRHKPGVWLPSCLRFPRHTHARTP